MDKQFIRSEKNRKRSLTKRLYAIVCMLLVCALLVTATTYAWLVLSSAPEVKDIKATVGANGNLEIALTSTEHLASLKANDMYDNGSHFEAVTGELLHDNKQWGNLVNLDHSDYGLTTMNMRPAVLNVLDGHVADAPISMVTYGSDGRAEDLVLDPNNPNMDTIGFSGVYNVNKGGYYAGSVSMSVNDLQSGNYDKMALVQSLLNSREYGVRVAGPLDYSASVNQDQTQANIDLMVDGYCFAIDMLFRTNATEANLLLQTDGTQRVDDEDYEYVLDFSGNGSYMEISEQKLSTAMRVVFADTLTGEVYALAQPDLQGKLWMTARLDTDGNLVVVKPGDAAIIKPLTANQVSAVTAWVYLDGTQVDNSYAATITNVAMKMNMQFATDMNLTPGRPDGNGTNGPPHQVFVGDTYTFGKYEQDNVIENGREPIEWTVVAVDKSKALLISKYAIEALPYDEGGSSNWSTSSIRNWLNSTFIDWSFTEKDQKALITTTINPEAERDDRIYDKVFLLSEDEVYMYLTFNNRELEITPFAESYGDSYYHYWWLRSESDAGKCPYVTSGGNISSSRDYADPDITGYYIRPAMWINLDESEKVQPGDANDTVADPLPGAVSSPRFELIENGLALNFNYPKYYMHSHNSLNYPIVFTDPTTGKEFHRSTVTNQLTMSGTSTPTGGKYTTIAVDTVLNHETTATVKFTNLSLIVTEEDRYSDTLYFRLYPSSATSYYFALFGLTPNTPFLLYTASERDALGTTEGPEYYQVISGVTDADGYYFDYLSSRSSIIQLKDDPNAIAEPTKLYFKIVELTDYDVSANGREASYTMGHLNDWTLYTPGGTGDNTNVVSGTDGNVQWSYTVNDETLRVSGSGNMKNYSSTSAPWYKLRYGITDLVVENGVTSIGDFAFNSHPKLQNITLPNSLKTIGENAFRNSDELTSIAIPEGVTTISGGAFCNCDALESVALPDSLAVIDNAYSYYYGSYYFYGVFQSCDKLKSITIPDNVTTIGSYAFNNCTALENIVIPDSVTTIGTYAFYNCTALENIVIPKNVTSIGRLAFYGCPATISVDKDNTSFSMTDGVLFNKNKTTLVSYPETKSGAYTIPDSVTTIEGYAFYGCDALTSVTIPNSVTSIGDHAFYGCDALTSVIIPDSVTTIGYNAFSNCNALTSVIIPDSVTSIESYTFYYCTSLTSVTIPDSVTTIGYEAFHYCDSLTDVYFNGSRAQWEAISINSNNYRLTAATIHFAVTD